jgi:hypothetical protein
MPWKRVRAPKCGLPSPGSIEAELERATWRRRWQPRAYGYLGALPIGLGVSGDSAAGAAAGFIPEDPLPGAE